jgi:hypothetical protein
VAGGETETDGLLGVVRDGEGIDFQIAKTEPRTGFEELPRRAVRGVEFGLDGAAGRRVGEDLDVGVLLQAVDGGGVIAVFVRKKNGVDAFEGLAGGGEERGEFFDGEAGVDEDARTFGHEQRGVARAAGTENAEAHGHIEGRDEARRGGRAKLKRAVRCSRVCNSGHVGHSDPNGNPRRVV